MLTLFKKKQVAEAIKNLNAKLSEELAAVTEYAETEVKISEKTVGGKVELIDGDGNLTPAPDGDFKIAGDENIYTVKDGQITAINGETPAEEEEAPKEEVQAAEEAPVEEAKPNEEMAALNARVEALENAIAEMQNMIAGFASKDDVAQFSSEVKSLNDTITKLAQLPAEFSKTNNSPVVKDKNKSDYNALAGLIGAKK